MNRIEELDAQAMDIVSNSRMIKGQVERTWDPKRYDQVFAELIIEDCVDRIKRVGILEDIENETDMVVNAVEEHFGMK